MTSGWNHAIGDLYGTNALTSGGADFIAATCRSLLGSSCTLICSLGIPFSYIACRVHSRGVVSSQNNENESVTQLPTLHLLFG